MDPSSLLTGIWKLSITTAALCLPAISIAYVVLNSIEGEEKRMARVITGASSAAVVLVICSIFTFAMLSLGHENEPWVLQVSSVTFVVGCLLILYVLLVLAGFRREPLIPKPRRTTSTGISVDRASLETQD